MLTEYGVLKPDLPRAGWYGEVYEFWREPRRLREQKEWADFFAIWKEAPRPHDPDWRSRVFSIQAVNDVRAGKFDASMPSYWVWGIVGILAMIAQATFYSYAYLRMIF